jgi:hypothetical protein
MCALMAEWQARKEEESEELHDRLMAALVAGKVDLVTDARMLDHSGSPVHSPWDHIGPLLGLMLLAMVILLSAGMAFGIVAMFFCAIIHLMGNRYYVAWRIQQRTLVFVQYSLAHWKAVWEAGGLAIVVKGSGEVPCFAPTGDWRKFVRRLIPVEGAQPKPVQAQTPPPVRPQPEPEPEYQPQEYGHSQEYEMEDSQDQVIPPPPPPLAAASPPPQRSPRLFEEQEAPPVLPPELGPNGRLELEG